MDGPTNGAEWHEWKGSINERVQALVEDMTTIKRLGFFLVTLALGQLLLSLMKLKG